MKEKFAQKMLDEKLDFLSVEDSLELWYSLSKEDEIETRFWWVARTEELGDNADSMPEEEIISEIRELYGDDEYALRIGRKGEEFDEFTNDLCPAYTYIDLIK